MAKYRRRNEWSLVSSRGAILVYIALHPGCTMAELADVMSLTHRTVWGLIGDLRRADMLVIGRRNREHHYTVNLDAPFLHPTIKGITLRMLLGNIACLSETAAAHRRSTDPLS